LLEDYRLLQHDVLLGRRYSLGDSASTTSSCDAPPPQSRSSP
jgi:hypothetical protein